MRTKRPFILTLGCSAAALFPFSAAIAQPANDACGSATAITSLPFDSGDVDAFAATDDAINPTCDSSTNGTVANNGVWFTFTPATTTTLVLNELDSLDTATSIWTGTCGALVQAACSDPETSTFTFNAGTTYFILVSRWSATNPVAGNTYQLTLAEGGACCNPGTGACTFVVAASCAAPGTFTPGGTCTPNLCTQPPVPTNDICSSAIALTVGTPVTGNNANATSTGDGPAASCQGSSAKGVWYTLTTAGGTFSISTCGSPQDTVLTVFTTDCTTFTQITGGCDDDSCDGVTPPGATTASLISALTLPAGTFHIRVSSFGSAPSGNNFTLVVTAVITGACCNNTTGACSTTTSTTCASGTFLGENTVCTPNPCPAAGACCVGTCCTLTLQTNCSGTFTAGGACGTGACGVPSGDSCAAPLTATVGANPGNNCGADNSVVIAPATQCGLASGAGGARDVFFRFTAPATATYTFDTCATPGFDTVLAVYSACPIDGTTVPLACNDDTTAAACSISTLRSVIADLPLTGGTTYIVRVAAYGVGTAEGDFVLNISQMGGGTTGACCQGTTCAVIDQSACTGGNTRFAGAGTTCNVAGNNTTPCCRSDFNQVGGITVQDIFDFLNAYFNNDPFADYNGAGGITVQDIFDFLNGYFAGCA